MKKIRQISMLFLLLFVTQIAKAQSFDMPLNFDSTNVTYTLTDFGGNVSSVVVDPVVSTNKVAKVIKTDSAFVWAGTTMGGASGFATAIAFNSSRTIIRMRIYSPDSGIAVRLKVEDPNDGTKSVETEARTTASNTWQTLTFNFINNASGTAAINYTYTYKKASVFFNFGVTGSTAGTKTYYFDDVVFPAATGPILSQITLPIYFDSTNVNYSTTDFGGNATTIITDPTNSLNKVAQTVKSDSAATWAGTTMSTSSGLANAIPFSSGNTSIRVRVYSPNSGIQVRLKAEDPNDPTKSVETEVTTTTSNAWETLTFNFANQATGTAVINYGYTYRMLSIFFNFGVTGATAGTKTYLWDNVEFGTGTVVPQLNMPVTFESTTLNYGLTDFGGNASSIVVDPALSTNKACKVIKSSTAETWAGTTIGGSVGFSTAIPFTATAKKISMRVYSPTIGTVIKMKVEDPNNSSRSVETEATTTVANGWQIMEFNFANQSTGTAAYDSTYTYKKLSVFFNFGVNGATSGEKTYYFDDVTFGTIVEIPQLNMPVTFESTTLNYGLTDFGGNASSIVVDPALSTNKACKVIKTNTAESWAGTTIGASTGFSTAIPFTSTSKTISMRVYSPTIGTPIRMKVEDPNDGGKSLETEATTTVANAWQTLEFNFANQATGTAAINLAYTYKKLSVFFNFGTTGAIAGEKTYYFDDVTFGTITPPVPSKVNIKFSVDTKNITLNANDTITLNGTFNGWCGACTPMTKTPGTNIWSTTIALDTATDFEFKYAVGAWVSSENLASTLSCTKTTGNFTNRLFRTAKVNDSIPLACWEKCTACTGTGGSSKTYLTFQVDMAKNKPAAGDTVTLNGTFNNWCGACNPMTNKPGTDIWVTSVLLDKDSSYDFKYTVGNWKSQELLKEGLSCTTTKSGFTNRTITVSKLNDTLPLVCWESCVSCLNTAPKAKVTFKVNMKNYVDDSLSIKGVTLNGSFNGWCGDCTKMTAIGNSIYSVTLTLDTGAYDYKFTVGNWLDQEQFIPTDPCTKTVGNFTNRFLSVTDTAAVIAGTYCWNTCTKCEAIGFAEQALNNVKIYPNPTTETLFIEMGQFLERDSKVLVYNMLGELMITKTSNQNNGNGTINLDTHSLKQGIYLLKIEADNAVKTIKFQIN